MPPADPASRAGDTPEASGDWSSGTLGNNMKTIFLLLLFPLIAFAEDSRIKKAIQDGIVTSTMLQALTYDEVPEKWKTTKSVEETKDYQKIGFKRGDTPVLSVLIPKKEPKNNPGMYVATVKIGDAKIASIFKMSGSTNILTHNKKTQYDVSITKRDDGRMQLLIMSDDGLFDAVEIDGVNTCLMDDLEFTKAMVAQENIVGPLMDSISETIDEKKNP